MMTDDVVLSALDSIDPAATSYDDWIAVGMALHDGGFQSFVWDEWSRRDGRYSGEGNIEKHWRSFHAGNGVTVGTIIHMAQENGWNADGRFDVSKYSTSKIAEPKRKTNEFDTAMVEMLPNKEIENVLDVEMSTNDQIKLYVDNVFEMHDKICFCRTGFDFGDFRSAANVYAKAEIGNCGFSQDSGGGNGYLVCINPTDGNGRKTENITKYRHALIECDPKEGEDVEESKRRQLAAILKLRLPCSAIVDSGNKSIHAIVRIDAKDIHEYAERVAYVMDAVRTAGIEPDKACKNCNRLSRLPGIRRGDKMQRLIAVRQGFGSFAEWKNWFSRFDQNAKNESRIRVVTPPLFIPDPKPEIIYGLMRKEHKGMLTATGKAGKTTLMMELAQAVASGSNWLGFECEQGNVLFVDPEMVEEEFYSRFRYICNAQIKEYNRNPVGNPPLSYNEVIKRVKYIPLRGKDVTISEIADYLISSFKEGAFDFCIFDSSFRMFEGNENDAHDVRSYLSNIDRINDALGCASMMTHHYGKGAKGDLDAKDRGRGSSVWADDPDAPITMIEIFPPSEAEDKREPGQRVFRIEDSGLRSFPSIGTKEVVFDWPIHRVVDWAKDWKPKSMTSLAGSKSGEVRAEDASKKADAVCNAILKKLNSENTSSMTLAGAHDFLAKDSETSCGEKTIKRYVEDSEVLMWWKEGRSVRIGRKSAQV